MNKDANEILDNMESTIRKAIDDVFPMKAMSARIFSNIEDDIRYIRYNTSQYIKAMQEQNMTRADVLKCNPDIYTRHDRLMHKFLEPTTHIMKIEQPDN